MAKRKFKELRVRFISVSVVITSLALILLQLLLYFNEMGYIALPEVVSKQINSVVLVIAVLFFTSLFLRLTIRWVFSFIEEPEERIFYTKIYSWSLYSIAIFIILYHSGVSLGNITLFVGLIATGLAFAVRDVLLSFFGWMILLRKKPFRIGDYIRIGEDEGKVLHIGTFYVLLDSTQDLPEDYTRVPNRLFLEKSIINLGKNHFHDHIRFPLSGIPVDKKERLERLQNEMTRLLQRNDHVQVFCDMQQDKLFLFADYLVPIEQKQSIRSQIVDLVFLHFGDCIVMPKS